MARANKRNNQQPLTTAQRLSSIVKACRDIMRKDKGLNEDLDRIEGVAVQVDRPAKTVADCFKYRNKIGLDVALEALRDYRQKYRSGMDELWRYAKICRVERVMRPYLEALA